MIKTLIALLISAPVLFATAFADSLPIKIEKAWLQAVPPVAVDTAPFMKIQNLGQTSLKLVGGFSAIATNVEPMITTMQEHDGHKMMGMESVPAFEIPPGGTLELKPGGNHLR
jgi:periplasmic copper chaperone A